MKIKEIIWLVGTLILALILNVTIFGVDGLKPDANLDLNIHDTYFIIANLHISTLLSVVVFFVIYLTRTLGQSFKNLTANLILMISTIFLVLVLVKMDAILETFINQTSIWTISPPLSSDTTQPKIEPKDNTFHILSRVLLYTQIKLLILLCFCGFKTGLNCRLHA